MHRTEIASHRGGAFLWPENSLAAFRETLRLAAVDQAECDVHLSADGEPIMGLAPELDNFYVACGFTAGIAASGGAGCGQIVKLTIAPLRI